MEITDQNEMNPRAPGINHLPPVVNSDEQAENLPGRKHTYIYALYIKN